MADRPTRRRLDFRTFDAVLADVDRLRAAGHDAAGSWDLARVLEHVTIFMRTSLDGFTVKVPAVVRLSGPLLKWWTLKKRWMPAGTRTPRPFEPSGAVTEAQAVADFRDVVGRVERHAGAFAPSPLFGRLTPEEWRQLHLIHASHHLGFLVPREGTGVRAGGVRRNRGATRVPHAGTHVLQNGEMVRNDARAGGCAPGFVAARTGRAAAEPGGTAPGVRAAQTPSGSRVLSADSSARDHAAETGRHRRFDRSPPVLTPSAPAPCPSGRRSPAAGPRRRRPPRPSPTGPRTRPRPRP